MKQAILGAVVALCTLSAGCDVDLDFDLTNDTSVGEEGVVKYAYHGFFLECLLGCPPVEPLAEGSVAPIVILNDEDLPSFDVASDAPEIAEFTQHPEAPSYIVARGLRPGLARVVLTEQGTGEVIDRLPLTVAAAERLEVRGAMEGQVYVFVGSSAGLWVDLFDAEGQELEGAGGVSYDVLHPEDGVLGEPHVFDEEEWELNWFTSIFGTSPVEAASFSALSPGQSLVTVTAQSGVETSVPITVIDSSHLTGIDLESRELETPGRYRIDATARVGDNSVVGTVCQWSIEGAATISYDEDDHVGIEFYGPGTAVVTCAIGDQRSSLAIDNSTESH